METVQSQKKQQRKSVTIYEPCRIDETAQIGEGTKVGAFCDIGKNVVIGRNCNIQTLVSISNECKIGNHVFLGPGVRLLNDKYIDGNIQPVLIEDNVRIGASSIINPGVKIHSNARIGSGMLVNRNVTTKKWIKTKTRIW